MPHSKLSIKEAAEYLQISIEDLNFLIQKREIPFFKDRGKPAFRKSDINDWTHQTLFKEKDKKAGKRHYKSDMIWSQNESKDHKLSEFLGFDTIYLDIRANSKTSLFKEVVDRVSETGRLANPERLLNLLAEREEAGSTGMTSGLAIPHPRLHLPELFFSSFLIVVILQKPIPYGSLDGELTDLLLLPCAQSDQEHIFMLSRMASLIKKADLTKRVRCASTADEVIQIFQDCENLLGL